MEAFVQPSSHMLVVRPKKVSWEGEEGGGGGGVGGVGGGGEQRVHIRQSPAQSWRAQPHCAPVVAAPPEQMKLSVGG